MHTYRLKATCPRKAGGMCVAQRITEIFKRPKNREDNSDLDENLTEIIAAMKTIISQIFFGQVWGKNRAKTSRNRRRRGRWMRRRRRKFFFILGSRYS